MHTQRVEYVRTKLESYTFIFAATCILLIGNGEKSLFALAGNSTQKKKYGEPITILRCSIDLFITQDDLGTVRHILHLAD